MSNNFKEYLESIKFFLASDDLIKAFFIAINDARNEDERINQEDEEQIAKEIPELEERVAAVEKQGIHNDNLENNYGEEAEISNLKRFISDQLYFHLGFLAKGVSAIRGDSFDIREVICEEMSRILGLSQEEKILDELASQFIRWLEEYGKVNIGWGEILYADGDKMYLSSSPEGKIEYNSAPALKRYRNPLPSPEKEKAKVAGKNKWQ